MRTYSHRSRFLRGRGLAPGVRAGALVASLALLASFGEPCTPFHPATDLLVVIDKSDDEAVLVDPMSFRALRRFPTGHGPHEVAIATDGRRAFVTNYGTTTAPGHSLTALDLRRAGTRDSIALGNYSKPHGIAMSRDGGRVWVTCEGAHAVIELDARTGAVAHAWPTGQEVSHRVVASRDERKLYVASLGSGSCTVIERATDRERVIPTAAGAEGIDITPDGREVWVANSEAKTL